MSLQTAVALATALSAAQTAPSAGWTWMLYEGDGPIVLANEVPDTADLRATLQCDARSSVVDITLYPSTSRRSPPAERPSRQSAPGRMAAVSPQGQTGQNQAPPAQQTEPSPDFARLTSGQASTTSELHASRSGRTAVTLRTDHPVFASFVGNGALEVQTSSGESLVKVERPHLAKLRRFADRCAG